MKILHVIDANYFETHKKIISELLVALSVVKIEQKIYTSPVCNVGWVNTFCSVERWNISKNNEIKKISSKLKTWMLLSSYNPDIIIKWGVDARSIMQGFGGVHISYMNEKENLTSFENTDYIMTNSDEVLSFVKHNGYSGTRSFLVSPFVYMYNNEPISKRDYFVPEKSKIVCIPGTFLKNIGYERTFDSLSVVNDCYFFIIGDGPDKDYVYNYASRVNIKARSRFIPEIEKSFNALSLSEFVFAPFDDPVLQKYIIEAMLQRKIVITVNNQYSSNLIFDGKTGFFVPKNDIYLIKKKLKEVLSLSDEQKKLITDNAFETAQKYIYDKISTSYIQMFNELINRYKSRKNLLNN